jgi:hypothetical protein
MVVWSAAHARVTLLCRCKSTYLNQAAACRVWRDVPLPTLSQVASPAALSDNLLLLLLLFAFLWLCHFLQQGFCQACCVKNWGRVGFKLSGTQSIVARLDSANSCGLR